MRKRIPCPDCAAVESFNRAMRALGQPEARKVQCLRCKGTGKISEVISPRKPRKEWSGDEWREEEERKEWEIKVMRGET